MFDYTEQIKIPNIKEVIAPNIIDGAVAPDAWFLQKGKTAMGTRDIDFAVLVTGEPACQGLKQFPLKDEGFTYQG